MNFFFKPLIHFIFFRIIVAVSFPFPPTAVYFLTSFRSTRSAGAFVRVCERACNALARPHARNPGVREWHAADTQQERSAHFPTASPPKQGAETRQEWRGRLSVAAWRCQSRAGEPKIAVITWSAADTHCDVCVCAWLCVYLCFFTRLVIAASHKREMDANHRSDIMIQAGRWNTPFASNISCLDIYLF